MAQVWKHFVGIDSTLCHYMEYGVQQQPWVRAAMMEWLVQHQPLFSQLLGIEV
ncbi:hypothetical protein U1Q18_024525 [Sarracenia purpurea var. burkii]